MLLDCDELDRKGGNVCDSFAACKKNLICDISAYHMFVTENPWPLLLTVYSC